jgi:hypothetical protein
MDRLNELELSPDHLSMRVAGTWMELPMRIENMKVILKPECEKCPLDKLEHCLTASSRNLFCETIGESKVKIDFGGN